MLCHGIEIKFLQKIKLISNLDENILIGIFIKLLEYQLI